MNLALKYYQLAANQQHPKAEFKLGQCFENGTGTEPNPAAALGYYNLSASHDNLEAIAYLGHIYETGRLGLDKNLPRAYEQYRLGA